MKNIFLSLFLLFVSHSFSQSVNDYKAVIIPIKYDFQKSDNQYRLQTITKINLQKAGFKAFYATEAISADLTDRCSLLYIDVKKDKGFLVTKLFVTLKDCFGNEIYKSDIGKSKEKEYQDAYTESLDNAFKYVYALNYAYNGNTNFVSKTNNTVQSFPVLAIPSEAVPSPPSVPSSDIIPAAVPVVVSGSSKSEPRVIETNTATLLFAQPTSYGYQLIDSEPKVIMKVYNTSNPNSFMAKRGDEQGVLVSKDNQWFFEYYHDDKLISEKVNVKF